MNFTEIAAARQSCRNFDADKTVEQDKLNAILNAARLAPSACNAQPYHFTVCRGKTVKSIADAVMGMGMNKFAADVPVMIVISEEPYNLTAAIGAERKKNDYRSIDIGIATAYLTAEATAQGLSTCIIGWLDDEKIKNILNTDKTTRLVIAVGYAAENDTLRTKKRKPIKELVSEK